MTTRITQVVLEVVAPNTPGGVPIAPWIVQVDWPLLTLEEEFPWDEETNPYVNFLSGYTVDDVEISCLRGIDFTRRAFHPWRPNIAADTCTIKFRDVRGHMWPGKTTSLLYPNVERDRPARVLGLWEGTFYPQFYGTIREIVPPTQFGQAEGRIVIESPLRALASLPVTPSGMSSPLVLDALNDLLTVAGFTSDFIAVDDTGITATFPGAWGGRETTFGAALRELILAGDLVVSCEPQVRLTVSDPDYQLAIWHTSLYLGSSSPPYATWVSTPPGNDLNGPQDVTYHGPEAIPSTSVGAVA